MPTAADVSSGVGVVTSTTPSASSAAKTLDTSVTKRPTSEEAEDQEEHVLTATPPTPPTDAMDEQATRKASSEMKEEDKDEKGSRPRQASASVPDNPPVKNTRPSVVAPARSSTTSPQQRLEILKAWLAEKKCELPNYLEVAFTKEKGMHIRVREDLGKFCDPASTTSFETDSPFFAKIPANAILSCNDLPECCRKQPPKELENWSGVQDLWVFLVMVKTGRLESREYGGYIQSLPPIVYGAEGRKEGFSGEEELSKNKQGKVHHDDMQPEAKVRKICTAASGGAGAPSPPPPSEDRDGATGMAKNPTPAGSSSTSSTCDYEQSAKPQINDHDPDSDFGPDDPTHWSTEDLHQFLPQTNLLLETTRLVEILKCQVDTFAFPQYGICLEEWKWARSVYTSRAFTAALKKNSTCPVMLPLIDVFNHKAVDNPVEVCRYFENKAKELQASTTGAGHQEDQNQAAEISPAVLQELEQPSSSQRKKRTLMGCLFDEDVVSGDKKRNEQSSTVEASGRNTVLSAKTTTEDADVVLCVKPEQADTFELELQPGQEVFNNYGPKGNEELLLGFGFTIENNCFDCMQLRVTVEVKEKAKFDQILRKFPKAYCLSEEGETQTTDERTGTARNDTRSDSSKSSTYDGSKSSQRPKILKVEYPRISVGPFFLKKSCGRKMEAGNRGENNDLPRQANAGRLAGEQPAEGGASTAMQASAIIDIARRAAEFWMFSKEEGVEASPASSEGNVVKSAADDDIQKHQVQHPDTFVLPVQTNSRASKATASSSSCDTTREIPLALLALFLHVHYDKTPSDGEGCPVGEAIFHAFEQLAQCFYEKTKKLPCFDEAKTAQAEETLVHSSEEFVLRRRTGNYVEFLNSSPSGGEAFNAEGKDHNLDLNTTKMAKTITAKRRRRAEFASTYVHGQWELGFGVVEELKTVGNILEEFYLEQDGATPSQVCQLFENAFGGDAR
ncbi:unnamed protein product [Amoebophrya sp. A120]|nr:unnamed protein product [Amoebophrya sp. A120]|eukprot:GSA120T00007994001.1